MKNKIRVIDHSDLNEQTHTPEEWYKMTEDLRRCIVKLPKFVYYHFLESVPPIYPKNGIGFFNSEPLTHNKEGFPVYYYFFKDNGFYYGCVTTKQTQEFCHKLALESLNEAV